MTQITHSADMFDPISPTDKLLGGFGKVYGRVEVMRKLSAGLPLNEIGLPNYIYRTDLIPAELYDEEHITVPERIDILSSASITLDYIEGYPSMGDGTPFWNQLPFEPIAAFNLFVDYLGTTSRTTETGRLEAPIRTLAATAKFTAQPPNKLQELSYMYYWPHRAKAHDLFMIANFQKQRQTRALLIEDEQYIKATKWANKAEKRLEEIFANEDELMDMKPREVLEMLVRMMALQRVSAGMPANGPGVNSTGPEGISGQGASLQTLLKGIATQAGERSKDAEDDTFSIDAIMDDPEQMAKLQELITKANVSSR